MKKVFLNLLICSLLVSLFASCTVYEETSKEESKTDESSLTSELSSEDDTSKEEYKMFDFSLLTKEELDEYISLGDYKGLECEKVVVEITDKNVEEKINSILSQYLKQVEVKDRPAKNGDIVTVDFKGFIDGEQFEGGTASDQVIVIGDKKYIDGFEEGIIGVSLGETATLNLKFPDNYGNEELKGKPVVFEITVKKIMENVLPELSEEIIKEYSKDKVSTQDDFKKFIYDELYENLYKEKSEKSKQEYWEKAIENATVKKFPDGIIQEYLDMCINYYTQYASMYGVTLEEFLGMSKEDYTKEMTKQAEGSYKEQMVLNAIKFAENFDDNIDEEKYKAWLVDLAEGMGQTVESIEKQYSKETLESTYIHESIVNIIYETRVEVEPKEEENSSEASSDASSDASK